jgi:uracil-DNA glycosylase family 4
MDDNQKNNNSATLKKKSRYFREAPDPKLPNYLLPPPSLKDFFDETYFERVEDTYVYKDDGSGEIAEVIKADKSVWVRGVGNQHNANVMFIAPCPAEEEIDGSSSAPALLKSGPGALLSRLCTANGIPIHQEYYTTLCKYALPRKLKLKPTAKDIQYCSPLLEEELALVKPSIIVCIGKEPASYILGLNLKLSKIEEGWIYCSKRKALVYIMSSPIKAYYKPEFYDKLDAELSVIAKRYDALVGGKLDIQEVEQDYKLINNYKDLQQWLIQMTMENQQLFAVDCEWRGMNYACGNLRSIQFCWAPGKAVFIHLFDENNKWVFDIPYDDVKLVLQGFFNQPKIRYFGHNFCADAVWMRNHLGIETLHKCILDTQYAFQTFNEYEELALKKLAAKYTDLGKYDLDLVFHLSKVSKTKKVEESDEEQDDLEDMKEQKIEGNDDDGYGSIPTEILFPYGCKDVDATYRLANIAFGKLIEDGTLEYYNKIKNPYVTDGFAAMMESGIPFSDEVTNKVRLAYLYCLSKMQFIFKDMLYKEAEDMYSKEAEALTTSLPDSQNKLSQLLDIIHQDRSQIDLNDAVKQIKKIFGNKSFMKLVPYFKHWLYIDSFNPSSADHKKLWLFDLKKYTPIKTTKGDSGNALDWDRVALLPPKEQENYKPAVDKETLKVYADRGDDLCQVLLEMNAVFTILKTFLKGDQGGLQKFVTNSQVFPNFSLTESNRPRSFKPNILNIPRYVTDWIKGAFKRVYAYIGVTVTKDGKEEIRDYSSVDTDVFNSDIAKLKEEYQIEETITKEEFKTEEIRNCFKARDGDYFVSADLKTAEIFAIGYLSGDNNLINALTGPDLQFAFKRVPDGKGGFKEEQVRVAYVDEIVKFSEDAKDPSLLTPMDDPALVRLGNGELKRPGRDLHWEAVEPVAYLNTPREKLDKEKTRNACGKVANFSIPYGASPSLLERSIEIQTKEKPEEGTGEKLINAYMTTKPDVAKFLQERENEVIEKGYYLSPTGFKRHYKLPDEHSDLPNFIKKKLIGGLQRQNKNIPLQSLVADTLAIAVVKLNEEFLKRNMKARVAVPLYDAMYVVAPWYEVLWVHKLIKKCFSLDIGWNLKGGVLNFQTDHETGEAWGSHLNKQEHQVLLDKIDDYWKDKDVSIFQDIKDITVKL